MPLLNLDQRQTNIVLDILQHYLPMTTVWAFGSRVGGGARPASDLDLVIMHPQEIASTVLLDVKEAFDASDLDIKVDIVLFNHLPPILQQKVQQQHVVMWGE